jgi:hypothetical protein
MKKLLIIASLIIFTVSIAACCGSKSSCNTKNKRRTDMGWM